VCGFSGGSESYTENFLAEFFENGNRKYSLKQGLPRGQPREGIKKIHS
jgi:hypothetical protein